MGLYKFAIVALNYGLMACTDFKYIALLKPEW